MRTPLVLGIVCFWAVLAAQSVFATEEQYPYTAYITTNGVEARSGPGESYYATERLAAGTEVEVYRHDPGGWYAIRPLPQSFSWVAGQDLRPSRDGLAEVITDQAPARVGSHLSDARDVSQVRLNLGEIVEYRGSKRTATGEVWHKISPPPGEFRWVPGKQVDPNYRPQVAQQVAAVEETPRKPVRQTAPEARPEPATPTTGAAPQPLSALPVPRLTPEQFNAQLEELNLHLSALMAQDISAWNFSPLAGRAQELMAAAPSAEQRAYLRPIADRIAQAAELKRRHDAISAPRSMLAQSGPPAATSPTVPTPPIEQATDRAAEERFDGVGRLARVNSTRVGAPRYALTDEQGRVRSYVSPSLGVSMDHYVGRRIGVTGPRGTLPDQQTSYLTAKQVTPLDLGIR